jgi:tripartite-type tricarboxylate transporter receptor subunit TctC
VHRRRSWSLVVHILALIVIGALPLFSNAQEYPIKPIKLIVPAAPGGGNDAIARLVAQSLSTALGQSVVVENRGGAGGNVGTDSVAKAAPDGYTLLLAFSGPLAMTPGLAKVPYDPVNSFAHIGLIAKGYQILVVHPSLPARNVQELIALAKAKPGSINYATAGNGTPLHLAAELFRTAAGIEIVHIPYKGSSPAATAVLAGDAQMIFGGLVSSLPHVKTGRLRALAVTSPQREAMAPDVPTMAEAGFPNVDPVSWYGISAPAGTPTPIIDRLSSELRRLVASKDYRELLAGQAQQAVGSTPAEFRAFIAADLEKWTKVIRTAGIKAD